MIPNASYVDRIVGVPSQPICPSSSPTRIELTINPKAPGLDLPACSPARDVRRQIVSIFDAQRLVTR
jgi:hypothetical protein